MLAEESHLCLDILVLVHLKGQIHGEQLSKTKYSTLIQLSLWINSTFLKTLKHQLSSYVHVVILTQNGNDFSPYDSKGIFVGPKGTIEPEWFDFLRCGWGQLCSVGTCTMQVWERHLLFRHEDLLHLNELKSSCEFMWEGTCSALFLLLKDAILISVLSFHLYSSQNSILLVVRVAS